MLKNRSAPPGPIVPWLVYEDVNQAIAWLAEAFGFSLRLQTPPEQDGSIHHAQMAVGEGSIVLTSAASPHPTNQALYVPVADVDAHFERASKFGARILNPPKTHSYGERQYNVEDLEGYRWTFSQSVADVNPEEWGAQVTYIQTPGAPRALPSFCYLEIPAIDLKQSVAFYEKLFGWNIRHRATARPSFDDASGHISGAWVLGRRPCHESGLLPYIWVNDIDATYADAAVQGGQGIDAPHPDHPGGASWIATFHDPAGNVIGLYQENHAAS